MLNVFWILGPGYLSRYSDSLRAGRLGEGVTVVARFTVLVQIGPEPHPASYTMAIGSFTSVNRTGRDADHPHLAPKLNKEHNYTSTPHLGLLGLLFRVHCPIICNREMVPLTHEQTFIVKHCP